MKSISVLVLLATTWIVAATVPSPAWAQPPCDWFPSSQCPASVPRSAASYPCASYQIKGNWNTMLYHSSTQPSYPSIGAGYNADVWCFDDAQEATEYGFQRSFR